MDEPNDRFDRLLKAMAPPSERKKPSDDQASDDEDTWLGYEGLEAEAFDPLDHAQALGNEAQCKPGTLNPDVLDDRGRASLPGRGADAKD